MAEVKFNINDLYARVYGNYGKVFNMPSTAAQITDAPTSSGLQLSEMDMERRSLLGTPLFMPCKIDDTELPNEPIIEIRGSKNIVKTQIDGQDGTFKELFSMNDYQIIIKGIITQEDGSENYPQRMVRAIRELCERKTDLKISNALTTIFGITNIAIEDFDFPALEGFQNVQPYSITASSDREIDIELKSE